SAGVGTRLGVGDVDGVVARDEDAARAAELLPHTEHRAALIEDLDAIVLAVADEQAAARVHRDRIGLPHLARAGSLVSPLLHEPSAAREPHDAIVLAVTMTVRDEDVAVRRDHDVRRLIEEIGPRARDAGLAERHEHLAGGAELEHLMTLA